MFARVQAASQIGHNYVSSLDFIQMLIKHANLTKEEYETFFSEAVSQRRIAFRIEILALLIIEADRSGVDREKIHSLLQAYFLDPVHSIISLGDWINRFGVYQSRETVKELLVQKLEDMPTTTVVGNELLSLWKQVEATSQDNRRLVDLAMRYGGLLATNVFKVLVLECQYSETEVTDHIRSLVWRTETSSSPDMIKVLAEFAPTPAVAQLASEYLL